MTAASSVDTFVNTSLNPPVRGFTHRPINANGAGLVLTHGAGSNCQGLLLISVAEVFAEAGFAVLRCDLPFRQARKFGPPRPGDAARDREGLKNAVAVLRKQVTGRIFLGGHSYGGRQATMLVAAEPEFLDGLLLFSYPLHPPRKPAQLRTQHFPDLKTPAMFVHGTRDPFGSMEEMESALKLVHAPNVLVPVDGAGHDLSVKKKSKPDLQEDILARFKMFFRD